MTRVSVVTNDPITRDAAARVFAGAPAAWEVTLDDHVPTDVDVVVWGHDTYRGEGLVFDPTDPEHLFAEIAPRAPSQLIIWVAAAGGGQGATTVATHLAMRASHEDASVCLVDLVPGSNTRYRLGIPFSETKTWVDADEDLMIAALPTKHRFRALLAPTSGVCDAPSLIARTSLVFDRVVVDAGSSLFPVVSACTRVLVMTPTIPAAHRAGSLLWRDENEWVIVLNRLGRGGEATRLQLEEILERPIATELPQCPALRDAEDDGRLLGHAFNRWTWRFESLVKELGL
ncbi:MAG: hypothetical protein M3290_02270 [Actinomycetota bacterium]|nr:hypothetical protein [Actinomycetota bacterium]